MTKLSKICRNPLIIIIKHNLASQRINIRNHIINQIFLRILINKMMFRLIKIIRKIPNYKTIVVMIKINMNNN